MRLISWNVNGIRAACRKGFADWLVKTAPEVVMVQEVKAFAEQMPKELKKLDGWKISWHAAERAGYSGVATFIREDVAFAGHAETSIGEERFDCEGRVLIHEFDDFDLYNIYFPNGTSRDERLQYKMDFYDSILKHWKKRLKKGRSLIVAGDVNTAHREIDLARPKANEETSGFLPIERAWVDKVLDSGFVDTFRAVNGDLTDQYSWWTYRANARANNVGWRIDYFLISEDLEDRLEDAFIWQDVMGSDHCPVGIDLS